MEQEIVRRRDGRLVAGVMDALVSESAGQSAARVIELVRRNPVETSHGIVAQVLKQLCERVDIFKRGITERRAGLCFTA